MNNELIRKALNEGTLRLANLSDLPVGSRSWLAAGTKAKSLPTTPIKSFSGGNTAW